MTKEQRDIYILLCMAGRWQEAINYRERCEIDKEVQGNEDGE